MSMAAQRTRQPTYGANNQYAGMGSNYGGRQDKKKKNKSQSMWGAGQTIYGGNGNAAKTANKPEECLLPAVA